LTTLACERDVLGILKVEDVVHTQGVKKGKPLSRIIFKSY